MDTASVQQLAATFSKRVLEESKILDEREYALKRARAALEEEKGKMQAFTDLTVANRELVEINVGGEIMSTQRQTLLSAPGSLLEAMFSGRWEQSLQRDAQGRVFLDYSPAVFRLLLSHLRVIRDMSPRKAPSPVIPGEWKAEFGAMLRFLGMHDFVFRVDPHEFALFKGPGAGADILKLENQVFSKVRGGNQCMYFSSPVARFGADDSSVSWSFSIVKLASWFFLGVIGTTTFTSCCAQEPSSFGWSQNSHVWIAGRPNARTDGWNGWAVGDRVVFTLDPTSKTLQMNIGAAQCNFMVPLDGSAVTELRICIGLSEAGAVLELVS